MTVTYRTHRLGDAARLAELTALAMPLDAVDEDWLAEYVLLEPSFDPSGLMVAEHEDGVVGFVYAVPAAAADHGGGYLTLGCVHPDFRRRGIGTELLDRAVAYLDRHGAEWVNFAAYPPAYFVPGLDAEAYPGAARIFERAGFRRLYQAVAMRLDLLDYVRPAEIDELGRERGEQGYTIARATYDDLPEVIAFATARLAPDWGEAVRDSAIRHGHIKRTILARDPDGDVIGFATYGAYRGILERFGPYGVDERARGTGLGKLLLHEAMAAMRAEGAQNAWFLWTGENSPAGHLYRRTGFETTRRFDVLRLDLT